MFFAEFNTVSARIHLNEPITSKADAGVQRTLTESKNMSSSKLLLRSYKSGGGGDNNEDRVDTQTLSSKIPGLVSKLFRSSSTQDKTIIRWLEAQKHPEEILKILNVGKSVAKRDDEDLLQWLRYVVAFRNKKGQSAFTDLDLYSILRKTNSREELVKAFQSLEDVPDLRTLATNMQKSMSGNTNINNFQASVNPDVLFDMVQLSALGGKLNGSPMFTQWLKYANTFREKRGIMMTTKCLICFGKRCQKKMLHVPGMKNHADSMLRWLSFESKTSHKVINDVWLNAKVSPEEVFKILQLNRASMTAFDDNRMLFQWIRYFERYRESVMKLDNISIYDKKLRMTLQKNNVMMNDAQFATLFQVIKDAPQLKRIGESMQTSVFKELLSKGFDPSSFSSLLSIPYAFD
ncbi:RxLR effector protein [Phytophthora megakarya]|uniref:RxLR effector protein n=1 Tax=Phytophthora megakarya TaxID=4795 RepID=A0A225WDN9_9STRA|nr:RxLR effector protein [Phytophthora megakarya]